MNIPYIVVLYCHSYILIVNFDYCSLLISNILYTLKKHGFQEKKTIEKGIGDSPNICL